MNDFVFCSPTRFVFGEGVVDSTGPELASLGLEKVLLVFGKGSVERLGTLDRVRTSLANAGVAWVEAGGARPNPEVEWVRSAIAQARTAKVDGVLAVGGGSAIDAAKAVAFGVPYEGDVWDFFDKKLPITTCLPVTCVLTIPAAGSEASGSCVVSNDAEHRKLGVSGDVFRPKLAIMDPKLTFSLPPYQTAAGVTDMCAHICERYFSGVGPVAVSDNIATGLIRAIMEAAARIMVDPADYDARATIMWAGTLAHNDIVGCGRSLTPGGRAGGWESHALEHELSAHHVTVTHGAGLAVLMPAWMRYVWHADPSRFIAFARDVFETEFAQDEGGDEESLREVVLSTIDRLQAFFSSLGMPTKLSEFGIVEADIEPMLETLRQNKGERFGAFLPLTIDDARAIYLSAL